MRPLSAFSSPAYANVIYSYTGNPFTDNDLSNPLCDIGTSGCFSNITATIELTTALGENQALTNVNDPYAWSISDGLTTITNTTTDYYLLTLQLGTDENGNIDQWRFIAANSALSFGEVESMQTTFDAGFPTVDDTRYCTVDGGGGACGYVAVAEVADNAGDWSTTIVPVPAAIWLFATGLLGLVGVARRQSTS